MSKHAPGTWSIRGEQYGLPQVWNQDSTEAVCERIYNGNARLIASAPDMLELLYESLPYVEECEQFNHPKKHTLSDRIRDII